MLFIESSAKENVNVGQAFHNAVETILKDIKSKKLNISEENLGIKVGIQSSREDFKVKKNKSDCC